MDKIFVTKLKLDFCIPILLCCLLVEAVFPKIGKPSVLITQNIEFLKIPDCIRPILKYFNVNAYLLYEKPSVECHAGTICSVTWIEYKSIYFSGLKVHMTKACKVNLRQN